MSEAHAATVADALVWANLRGVDSHGVSRVPRYVEMIEAGDLNTSPVIKLSQETSASVLIDAGRAAGHVAMSVAIDAAVRKASSAGIGLALVRATTHAAALGYYAQRAADQGYAAIITAASIPNMAYYGARAAGVSTSPLCIAVPGGDHGPLMLDMGTGVVSIGKLAQARRQGKPIPKEWALDKDGNRTTDAQRAEIPLPMAGPKGSGLALLIECVTSLIVDNPILAETVGRPATGRRHRQNALAIAIDIARFCDPKSFGVEVDRLVAALKNLPRDADTAEILMPGERARRAYDRRVRDGIPVSRVVVGELNRLACELGVAPLPEATSGEEAKPSG